MATFNDESLYQFIGNVTNGANTTIATLPAGSVALFDAAGANVTGALSATSQPLRVVAKKADGNLSFSPFFSYSELMAAPIQKAFALDTQQVSYLGTNSAGTVTGLGTVTAGNAYIVDIEMLGSVSNTYTSPFIKTISYQASTGDATFNVAQGLFESAVRITNRLPVIPIKVDRIADIASVAALTGTSTISKVTKGSKTVSVYIKTADGTAGLTASTASVAASTTTAVLAFPSTDAKSFSFTAVALGSGAGHTLVTIGEINYLVADAGTDAQNATAIAVAINAGSQATAVVSASTTVTISYKAATIGNLPPMVLSSNDDSTWTLVVVTVVSGDSKQVVYRTAAATTTAATYTLDEPWQGETGYVYEGTTAVTGGVATLTTGLWGLKFTAKSLPFDPIVGKYELVRFNIKPKLGNQMINPITGTGYTYALGFDSTVIAVDAQLAAEGSGMYQEVAEMELLASWQNRPMVVQTWPPTVYSHEATVGKEYTITSLRVKKQSNRELNSPNAYITINIAIDKMLTTNDNAVLVTVFTATSIA